MAIAFGAANQVDGWRFATYPTFARRFGDTRTELRLEVQQNDTTRGASVDEVFSWVPERTRNRLPARIASLDVAGQRKLLTEVEEELGLVDELRVVAEVYSTDPDDPRLLREHVLVRVSEHGAG